MKTAPAPWSLNDEPGSFLIKDARGRLVASSEFHAQIISAVNAAYADVPLALDLNEAQAILNALRESGVLDAPMIFHHVATLKAKVESGIRSAGHNPL